MAARIETGENAERQQQEDSKLEQKKIVGNKIFQPQAVYVYTRFLLNRTLSAAITESGRPLLGTKEGLYIVEGTGSVLINTGGKSKKKPVFQLELVPEEQLVVLLSGNKRHIRLLHSSALDGLGLEEQLLVVKLKNTKGCQMFCTNTGHLPEKSTFLCVAMNKTIRVFEITKNLQKHQEIRKISVAGEVQFLDIWDDRLCVGYPSCFVTYSLLKEESPHSLVNTEDSKLQFLVPAPVDSMLAVEVSETEYFLAFRVCGIYVDSNGNRRDSKRQSVIVWPETPTSISYSAPFILCYMEKAVLFYAVKTAAQVQKICLNNPELLNRDGTLNVVDKFVAPELIYFKNILNETTFHPRQCHVIKWQYKQALGLDLYQEHGDLYIGKIDEGSPAQSAGLLKNDRLIELNNINIENETSEEVMTRMVACGGEIKLLVVDKEADVYYKSYGITVTSSLDGLEYRQSPTFSETTFHPRQCHVISWQYNQGCGFHLYQEHGDIYIGEIEEGSPAESAGLLKNDRLIELNNENIENETSEQVINIIEACAGEIKLLVVDKEADTYYKSHGITLTSTMEGVIYKQSPTSNETTFHPRQCHVIIWQYLQEFGFHLDLDQEHGLYIGEIEEGSPAESAGLLKNDRLIELNNENIENETSEQVINIIKACAGEIKLLVVDKEADTYYKSHGITLTSTMEGVIYKQSPTSNETTFHPRQCHVIIWQYLQEFGFHLDLDQEHGLYIGEIDESSPAQSAGLLKNDRLIELNNENIENKTSEQVITIIKACAGEIKLLVVDKETDTYYRSHGITLTSTMEGVIYKQSPTSNETNFHPRQCHVINWQYKQGFGFGFHFYQEHGDIYIGEIEDGSPAESAGLLKNDRLIELNNENIENETSCAGEIKLLVVDKETDTYYRSHGITLTLTMEGVEYRRSHTFSDLKSDLIDVYRRCHQTLPISPVLDDRDVFLLPVYVQPTMCQVEIDWLRRSSGHQVSEEKRVISYQDIFHKGSEVCENIYIRGKAGIGKTLFIKKLALTWCQAHEPVEREQFYFSENDVNEMKEFDFLFLILLRDVSPNVCDVDGMVHTQIISELSRSYSMGFLEEVLHQHQCLIVLDGLDEWSHQSVCRRLDTKIPHRKARKHCKFITTTRSWKLNEIQPSQIDVLIEMTEFDNFCVENLIVNVLETLIPQGRMFRDSEILKLFVDSKKSFIRTPLMITYLACLFADGQLQRMSRCKLYESMIDLLLLWSECKSKENKTLQQRIKEKKANASYSHSKYTVVRELGCLAFKLSFENDSSHEITSEEAEGLLSAEMLKLCIQNGLLSQQKQYGSRTHRSTVSFMHKTIQEYFAARFLQASPYFSCFRQIQLSSILEMSDTFIVLSGIDPAAAKEVFSCMHGTKCRHGIDYTHSVDAFRRYRKTLSSRGYFDAQIQIKEFQNMAVECVMESKNNGQEQINLSVKDIIIDYQCRKEPYKSALTHLTSVNKSLIESILFQDLHENSFHDVLDNFDIQNLPSLQKLDIFGFQSAKGLEKVMKSASTLKYLQICAYSFNVKKLLNSDRFVERNIYLLDNSILTVIINLQHLKGLHLEGITLTHQQLKSVLEYVESRKCLSHIGLTAITCSDRTCSGHYLDIDQHEQLQVFSLCSVPLSGIRVDLSKVEELSYGCLSEEVDLDLLRVSWRDLFFDRSIHGLPYCRSLTVYHPASVFQLICFVRRFQNLKHFMLSLCDIGERDVFKYLNLIEDLSLHTVTMRDRALNSLFDLLEKGHHPLTLKMVGCSTGSERSYEDFKNKIMHSGRYTILKNGLNIEGLYEFTIRKNLGR